MMSSNDDDNILNTNRSNRARMETDRETKDLWLDIEIRVSASQPELLSGLEQWLQLDLISQAQVKKLARYYLSCTLPEPKAIEPATKAIPEPQPAVVQAASPNLMARVWQGFLDELSIRWLLFLGIFLVIISSGATFKGFLSRTTRSANLPFSRLPLRSSSKCW